MSALIDFVIASTVRGECQCGKCFDKGDRPDPTGHTVDTVFFKVALRDTPARADFEALTRAHHSEWCTVNPFDGAEHNYLELGGWIGDQGLALQYMALGALVGAFELMTPLNMLPGLSAEQAARLAGMGMVTVKAAQASQPAEATV